MRLLPASGQAEVHLTLADGSVVRSLDFDLGKHSAYSDFHADGQWQVQGERGFGARPRARPSSAIACSSTKTTGRRL